MRWMILLCVVGLGGCGISTPLGGKWVSSGPVAGSGFEITLGQTGRTVSGIGHQNVEAGATRDFSVGGTLDGSHLTATFYYNAEGTVSTYDAQLDGDGLKGQLTESSDRTTELDLTRQ